MVIDSNLKLHLAHFGIDMNRQQKTEPTASELAVVANLETSMMFLHYLELFRLVDFELYRSITQENPRIE